MNDTTIVYRTYYNPMEANIIRARLEDAGFACFLADENVATLNPLYNQAIGGVKLVVFERDVESINQLLAEEIEENNGIPVHEDQQESSLEIICEKCGSANVGYGFATQHRYGLFAKILAFLTFTTPVMGNKCYHCYDCGYEFEKK